MSKKAKRFLSIAAAVAVPFAAPVVAGAIFTSGAGWLATAGTGAVLGAGVASASGGSGTDIRRGALLGGIGSGVNAYMQGASALQSPEAVQAAQTAQAASTAPELGIFDTTAGTPSTAARVAPRPLGTVAGTSAGAGTSTGAGLTTPELTFGQYMSQPSTYVPLALQTGLGAYGAYAQDKAAEEQQQLMDEYAQQQLAANEQARQDQLREYGIRNQMADLLVASAPTGGEYAKQAETATRAAGLTATEQGTREALSRPGGARRGASIEAMRRRGEVASALGGARAGAEGYQRGEAERRGTLTTAAGLRGTPPAATSYEALRQAYAGRGNDMGDMFTSAGQYIGGLTAGYQRAQERAEDRDYQDRYLAALRGARA